MRIARIHEEKDGNKWVETFKDTNETSVYKDFSQTMINHYICKADYYSRIQRVNLYNGFCKVTVNYKGVKARDIYIIADR